MIEQFKSFLLKSNLAPNTIESYIWTVRYFIEKYPIINKQNLIAYKGFLLDNYKAQTVNLRLQAINKYLDFAKKSKLKMTFVKMQQKNFLENVISQAEKHNPKKTAMRIGIFWCGFLLLQEHV